MLEKALKGGGRGAKGGSETGGGVPGGGAGTRGWSRRVWSRRGEGARVFSLAGPRALGNLSARVFRAEDLGRPSLERARVFSVERTSAGRSSLERRRFLLCGEDHSWPFVFGPCAAFLVGKLLFA